MIAAWVKALLFVAGGVTAAAGTAYVTGMLDPWFGKEQQTIAALPEQPAENGSSVGGQAATDAAVPQPEAPQTTEKQDRLRPPTFDLLRVEPDGSVVVAGKSAPEASVEVITGERVLAKADATPEGDFVAVLDAPLEPGDYQLTLRATTNNQVAVSTETAIVSIPETPEGEVLAMVEEPGKPAEIVTAPKAAGNEEPAAEPAALPQEEVAAAAEETASDAVAEAEQPAEQQVAAAPAEEDVAKPEGATADASAETQKPEDQAAAGDGAPADGETTGEPADADVQQSKAPAADEAEVAQAPAETAEEEAPGQAAEGEASEQEVASTPLDQPAPETQAGQAVEPSVAVEAVEIEGDTVFVAGSATPGRTVRIYADALHLGDAKASDGGRFLVETKRDLPVGDYVIRADLLDADGSVIARAAVPFEREPGESIAAVAAAPQPAPAGEPASDEDSAAAPASTLAEQTDQPAPAEEDVAAAPAPAQPEGQAVDESKPADQDNAAAPETDAPAPAADEATDLAEEAAEQPETQVAAAPAASDETAVTAPKLQKAEGAVIIRRGDNLWRISRRVYGKGIRYSTIYLANQDQISDPDLIWPGQVFSVPQETSEGEAADLDAMGDQVVPPDTESKIIR